MQNTFLIEKKLPLALSWLEHGVDNFGHGCGHASDHGVGHAHKGNFKNTFYHHK